MFQNKIFLNFSLEILKIFLTVLFALSMIALTVRAVNFLDLIVDNGYSIIAYFQYSLLNLLGISIKFIPLSFLISLTIFILKHQQDNEFIILWTSGVKKMSLIKMFIVISFFVALINLIFSTYFTPLALNKSRQLLNNENFNSFLPTVKSQKFNDSFKSFTFFVEKKKDNRIANIFIYDAANNLKNISPNVKEEYVNTILAESGIIESKKLLLFNGKIISEKKNSESEILNFQQIKIGLENLDTMVIKKPKIQETSTITLIKCLFSRQESNKFCNDDFKKEIISTMNRRFIAPLYIPVISLICALALIRTKKIYFSKYLVFFYSFVLLVFTELIVRYTGLNDALLYLFIFLPFLLMIFFYFYLIYKFTIELKHE